VTLLREDLHRVEAETGSQMKCALRLLSFIVLLCGVSLAVPSTFAQAPTKPDISEIVSGTGASNPLFTKSTIPRASNYFQPA
jgi:hypothetical protein